jgi:hypothetical protein
VIEPAVKKAVIAQYLQGVSRDRIAADNDIGAGTVSNIIRDFKKRVQDSDFSSVRELAIHCKKEGVDLRDLASALRIKNHYNSLTQLDTNVSEEQVEVYIYNLASSPDPTKLIEAAGQISESGIPLGKLEEHVKALKTEKETLQREIDEGRAILDGFALDVESRRKLVEEYAQMKVEMRRYGIGPEDPRKIQACLRRLKDANYNAEEVIAGYANMEALSKERMELDEERRAFDARVATVKDVLSIAEQTTLLKIGIGELLAFHSAVYERADRERIPHDTAAYKIVEDIRVYSQLGSLKKERDGLQQQILMLKMFMASM